MSQPSISLCLCLSSALVPFTWSLNATTPGWALLSFLDDFSSMLVSSTLLFKGTTPRQALFPLHGNLPGLMIAATLLLQVQRFSKHSTAKSRLASGWQNSILYTCTYSPTKLEAKRLGANMWFKRLCACAEREIWEITVPGRPG